MREFLSTIRTWQFYRHIIILLRFIVISITATQYVGNISFWNFEQLKWKILSGTLFCRTLYITRGIMLDYRWKSMCCCMLHGRLPFAERRAPAMSHQQHHMWHDISDELTRRWWRWRPPTVLQFCIDCRGSWCFSWREQQVDTLCLLISFFCIRKYSFKYTMLLT